jgi:DNA-binding PadR family transcriptional regulator
MLKEMVVLALLNEKPGHGYEIKKKTELFASKDFINNNQLYPILRKFTEMGFIQKETSNFSHRVIYKITKLGKTQLNKMLKNFGTVEATNQHEFFMRVSMFGLFSIEEKQWILKLRRKILEEQLLRNDHFQEFYNKEGIKSWKWGMEIINYRNQCIKDEIHWIDNLSKLSIKEADCD